MSQIVPLAAIPAQTLSVVLANQNCQVNVYRLGVRLYLDLTVATVPILTAMVCRNAARLLLDRTYLGFVGDLVFLDTQASTLLDGEDPVYTGLGAQFQLVYLTGAEIAAL
jgi:hypothetical protein